MNETDLRNQEVEHTFPTRWLEEASSSLDIPQRVTVYDGTLRKLPGTAGIRPTVDDMLFAAELVEKLGIDHVMMNVFWSGDTKPNAFEYESCKAVLERNFEFDVSVYGDAFVPMIAFDGGSKAPPATEALEQMASLGMKYVTPVVVDPKNADRRLQMEDDLETALEWIRNNGLKAVLCIGDPARADYDYLIKLTEKAIAGGVERIDLHDTASSLAPSAAEVFFRTYQGDLTQHMPMTCHIHDDFGMATASTVSATTVGINPEASLLGLSYRSGFAALEEVVVALETLYDIRTGINLEMLADSCDQLAARVGLDIDPLKPVVGRNQFVRNLPLWMASYFTDNGPPHPASLYDPQSIGRQIQVVWDHNFSVHALGRKANIMGLQLETEQVADAAQEMRNRLDKIERPPRWLEDAEVEDILRLA